MDYLTHFWLVGSAAQVALLAFMLWPIFRVVRKAGYSRRYAWVLCTLCGCGSLVISVLDTVIAKDKSLLTRLVTYLPPDLFNIVGHFVFSPAAFGAIPFIYFTFRKWPLEGQHTEATVFG